MLIWQLLEEFLLIFQQTYFNLSNFQFMQYQIFSSVMLFTEIFRNIYV